jgi:YfiR/HmsC-like
MTRAVLFCSVLIMIFPGVIHAESAHSGEDEVKAAYLYKFGRFVRWPENATLEAPFSVCVLGKDPFGKTLDTILDSGSWEGKPVTAKRIGTVDDAAACNILFISSSEWEKLDRILPALEERPILTVSEAPRFARRGGIIEFVIKENRVRFEVNAGAAQRAGLTLNSQLLKIATRVRQTAQMGAHK